MAVITYRANPAYKTSVFLHGLILISILVFVYWRSMVRPEEVPTVFELVAGEGDEYAATEAPALGTPGGIKIEVPAIPQPEPTPVAVAPEPEPVITPAPVAPKAAPVMTSPTIPNMKANIERLADKREANIRKKVEQEQKAAAAAQKKADDAAKRKAESEAKSMTKAEFDRQNANNKTAAKTAPPPGPITTKRIDAEGIAKGVVGGSRANTKGGAGGTAMAQNAMNLDRAYIQLILSRIRQALEGASFNDALEVGVQFQVSATGAISNPTVSRSSGNPEFDRAVIAAFRTIRPVGPPPTKKAETFNVTLRLLDRA